MNRRASKTASLTLIEMILVVFFFAVSAIVCTGLFVSAHQRKEQSTDLTNAVVQAQNAAEIFYASKGSTGFIANRLPECRLNSPGEDPDIFVYRIWYDENWNILGREFVAESRVNAYSHELMLWVSVKDKQNVRGHVYVRNWDGYENFVSTDDAVTEPDVDDTVLFDLELEVRP